MTASIEQLEAFVETVQQGSFKKAGLRIGKHITTVSGLVAGLEAELGLTLFIRKPRSLELTGDGKAMLHFAQAVLRESDHLEIKASSLLQGAPARLCIALDAALQSGSVSRIYHALRTAYPGLELKLMQGDPMQVRHWLLSGQADIGFSLRVFQRNHELVQAKGYSFDLVAIAAPELTLGEQCVERAQLRGLCQVLPSFMLESGVSQATQLSNHLIVSNDLGEMLSLVETGPAWGYLPLFLCKPALADGRVERIYLSETEMAQPSRWETEILWSASRPVNPAMSLFIQKVAALPDR